MEQEDFGGGPLCFSLFRSLWTNLPSRGGQRNSLSSLRHSGAVRGPSPSGKFAIRSAANKFDTLRSLCDNHEKPSPRSDWKYGRVPESETAINWEPMSLGQRSRFLIPCRSR